MTVDTSAMTEASPDFYEFGPFQLWPAERELRRGSDLLPLTTKAFDLLLILVRGANRILTRAELIAAVWGDTAVEETNLSQTIFMIRKTLGDDSEASPYIVTVPRVGYRFAAEVNGGFKEIDSTEPPTRNGRANGGERRRIVGALSMGALAVLTMLVAFNFIGLRERIIGPPASRGIRSLAVLPLENLSDDPDQDYLADGMTDGLIATLAKVSAVRVVSRTSVMPYRGGKKSVREIARELKVDAVLEGTVRRARNRVWISAQLVRASPEEHLWAETYDGDSQEVLALQERVARAVLGSLKIKPTLREQTLLTSRRVDPVAYEDYLKGRNMWERPSDEDLRKSRDYYNAALQVDPTYAPI